MSAKHNAKIFMKRAPIQKEELKINLINEAYSTQFNDDRIEPSSVKVRLSSKSKAKLIRSKNLIGSVD
jgi:hypothetical protein